MRHVKAYAVCLLLAVVIHGCALQGNRPVAPSGPNAALAYGYAGLEEIALAVEELRATCEVARTTSPNAQCLVDDEKALKVKAGLEDALERPEAARELLALYNGAQLESLGVPPQVAKIQGVLAVMTLILEARQ